MENLESIKIKVKKLLALSKSPCENEAALALKKAMELIAEYHLYINQFTEYTELKVKNTKRFVGWRATLANAVENLYATWHYSDNIGNIVFIGSELDVFMSSEMYKYLIKTIERMAKQNIRKNAKYKFRQSYKMGVANRLYDRMQELGQSCSWRNQTELKAQKKQISEFVKKEISIQTKKGKLPSLNTTAFARGFSDGKDINLSRQMTGTKTKRIGSH